MIDPVQIPDEVVDALHSSLADDGDTLTEVWDCRVAIAAALNAWPGCYFVDTLVSPVGRATHNNTILPLPKEKQNDKA